MLALCIILMSSLSLLSFLGCWIGEVLLSNSDSLANPTAPINGDFRFAPTSYGECACCCGLVTNKSTDCHRQRNKLKEPKKPKEHITKFKGLHDNINVL